MAEIEQLRRPSGAVAVLRARPAKGTRAPRRRASFGRTRQFVRLRAGWKRVMCDVVDDQRVVLVLGIVDVRELRRELAGPIAKMIVPDWVPSERSIDWLHSWGNPASRA